MTTPPPAGLEVGATAVRLFHVSRASRALEMAERALDANAEGGPDLPLAAILLRHALLAAGSATAGGPALEAPDEALDALERAGVLARAGGSAALARRTLRCVATPASGAGHDRESLLGVDDLLAAVLRDLHGGSARSRAARLLRATSAAAVVASVLIVTLPTLTRSCGFGEYRWTASSAEYGYVTSGWLGEHGSHGLIFHTKLQDNPFVVIDLRRLRSIHEVAIKNRSDCCQSRCLPLVVEAAGEDGAFAEVGRRTEPFDDWRAEFPARSARYVRLRVDGSAFFHLQDIVIR